MDPDGDYEIRHSIRSTASDDDNPTSIDDLTSPSKIFAPGSDVRLPGKSPKGGDAHKGPTAPPMEEDSPLPTAPTATDAAASSMDPRGNAYADMMRDTKMMGLEPPVSNSVAVPIGFDSDVMALPEATALPIVSSTTNEGTKMPPAILEEVNVNDAETQVDEEEPTPVLVPSPPEDNQNRLAPVHVQHGRVQLSATAIQAPKDKNGELAIDHEKRRKWCFCFLIVYVLLAVGIAFGVKQTRHKRYPDCNLDGHVGAAIGNGHCDSKLNNDECGWDGGDCDLYNSYPDCHVDYPDRIGDGICRNREGYNTAKCGWDGGDCVEFNEQYPDCHVVSPSSIGNGHCSNGDYNTAECGWDGGDCLVDGYPDCHVDSPRWIGDGGCNVRGSYNTAECGWDGGDCLVDRHPDCHVDRPYWIGNGHCDGGDYNTAECGWDGGDCATPDHDEGSNGSTSNLENEDESSKDWPGCNVDNPGDIGDGDCNGGEYNTAECGWDGGDCLIDGYPDCHVDEPGWIGDGECDGGVYNTAECGWDGGDCLVDGYPDCHVDSPRYVGDDYCHGDYNTAECGWDGGDCVEFNALYPDCHVGTPSFIGNGRCEDFGEYNTAECGWDGGDCVEFNEQYPDCHVDTQYLIGDGRCHGGEYNTAKCGWDGGDCIEFNEQYPDCHVDNPYWLGNGGCHGGEYNTAECGWDGGDCL